MYITTRYTLRLCRKQSIIQKTRFHCTAATNNITATENSEKPQEHEKFSTLLERYKELITFNSYLESDKLKLGYQKYYEKTQRIARTIKAKEFREKFLPPLPLSLQYYVDKERLLNDENEEPIVSEPEQTFQLPFASTTSVNISPEDRTHEFKSNNLTESEINPTKIDHWMTNYEYFDDTKLAAETDEDNESLDYEWSKQYGTPDPTVRISKVPCGGCGALLHCSDPAIPGYLPSEIYKGRNDNELKTLECQRCHFLKEYNIALDVSVQPEEYEKLLQSIRSIKSLVVLMVDLLDFPCSIWPGIVDIIGKDRPIIIVGNKVDLLPGDSIGYLKRVRESFIKQINKTKLGEANVRHIALISAKTGYGVENLISAMFKVWLCKGDVFLVGCTNVGKSSLFNALLQSDYCKVQAVDIVKRATVSRWPGTTLNLLKFPINRMSGWKIHQRTQRLRADTRLMKIEKHIRRDQIENIRTPQTPNLIGHIGRSFSDPQDLTDVFQSNAVSRKDMVLNEKHSIFARSKWLYDTPGVIHPDQVLSLLTTEELLITIPKQLIRPQTYYLRQGSSIFIGGLARIDFLECPESCRFTIFCSESLPITVAETKHANVLYEKFLGTDLFGAPMGGVKRLKNWPGLHKHEQVLEFEGEGPKWCCGDVVLSSAAWVAVTAKKGSVCKIAAWTPNARGVHLRYPSVLPYAINLKGKRLRDTPAYMIGKVFIDDKYKDTYSISNEE